MQPCSLPACKRLGAETRLSTLLPAQKASAEAALQAQRQSFFFALIVIADLTDKDCLVALDTLRRRSPRSWMIVATSNCDDHARNVIHRHGGDTCISLPIDPHDLIARLDAFQLRARPSF